MTACPVAIDTGTLIKDLRGREHGPRAQRAALELARRYATAERVARVGCRAGRRVAAQRAAARCRRRPPSACPGPSARARPPCTCRPASTGSSAGWATRDPPPPAPACPRRWWRSRPARGGRCGFPPTSPGHCCGTPWSSKGYADGLAEMAARTAAALRRWTGDGRAAGGHGRQLVQPRPAREPRPRRAGGDRLGELGPRSPARASRDHPPAGLGRRPPDVRHRASRRVGQARRGRRPARRRGRGPGGDALLRDGRRPGLAAPRAARPRRWPTRPPSSTAGPSTPACRATAPARSPCSRSPGAPTSRSCSPWRRSRGHECRRARRRHRSGCATAAATSRSCATRAARCSRCAGAPRTSPSASRATRGCRSRSAPATSGLLGRKRIEDDQARAVLSLLELLGEQPAGGDLIDQAGLGRAWASRPPWAAAARAGSALSGCLSSGESSWRTNSTAMSTGLGVVVRLGRARRLLAQRRGRRPGCGPAGRMATTFWVPPMYLKV